jgi:branched-subunit amino acid transport protein
MHEALLIAGMFAVTFSIRYLPFAYAHKISFPLWLQQALSYVPVAALTAIIAPVVLFHGGDNLDMSLHNAHLLTAIVALVISVLSKSMLFTVASGLMVFALVKFML